MAFILSDELIETIVAHINNDESTALQALLADLHFADIAEIIDELNLEDAVYVVKLIDSEKSSEALMELDEAQRERVINALSPKEIAEELEEMDTDDAADI
jgi:Mg/Co/Ni transporter MgtE (contains CBS domain)